MRQTPNFILRGLLPAWTVLSLAGAVRLGIVDFQRRHGRHPSAADAAEFAEVFMPAIAAVQPIALWISLCFGGLWALAPGLFRLHRIVAATCPNCGYSLQGNVSGRCPECGTPFEPAFPPAAIELVRLRVWIARGALVVYLAVLSLLCVVLWFLLP